MNIQSIFDIFQTGYDSRLGSENMPKPLSKSPQTDSQRTFVKNFYKEVELEVTVQAQAQAQAANK